MAETNRMEINYGELVDSWVDQHKSTVNSLNSIKDQVVARGKSLEFLHQDETGKPSLVVIPAKDSEDQIRIHLFDPKVKDWRSTKKGKTYSFWPDMKDGLQGRYHQWDYDDLENTQNLDHYYKGFYAKFSSEYKNLVGILSSAQTFLDEENESNKLKGEITQDISFLTQAIPHGNTVILKGITIGHYLEPKTGPELIVSIYDKNLNPWTYKLYDKTYSCQDWNQDPNQLRRLHCALAKARNQLAKEAQG